MTDEELIGTPKDDVIVTPKGNRLTRKEWEKANALGMGMGSMQEYAKWLDGWATPVNFGPEKTYSLSKSKVSDIKNIRQEDLAYVKAKYPELSDPVPTGKTDNAVLKFGPDDSDVIRRLMEKRPQIDKFAVAKQ